MRIAITSLIVHLLILNGLYSQEIFPGLNGDALLSALVDEYKTSTVLSYSDAREFMYTELDNVNDSVLCIYTDHRRYLDPNAAEPIQFILDGGRSNGINAEHVYPQSKGARQGQPRSDLHHLFPARVNANSARGSSPLAEIPDNETTTWFLRDQELSNAPAQNRDAYTEFKGGSWEPREPIKGDIARAVLYFYTMYQTEADAADPDYFQMQLEDVCAWHYEDPADDKERSRNNRIAEVQGEINPFIQDCSLASRSYCSTFVQDCPVINTIALHPTRHYIRARRIGSELNLSDVPVDGEFNVQVFLASGQSLSQQTIRISQGASQLILPSGSIKNALLIVRLKEHKSQTQFVLKIY